jgi:large subunit ribosomal protein L17
MRHRKKGRKLSRTPAHKRSMMANLAMSLFEHERITTTTPKAKELRPYAEKLITLARRGDLHARRLAARVIQQPAILEKLFSDIAPRFAERPGGYTRIIQIGPRAGDNAPMAMIELVDAAEAEVMEYTPEPEGEDMGLDEVAVDA